MHLFLLLLFLIHLFNIYSLIENDQSYNYDYFSVTYDVCTESKINTAGLSAKRKKQKKIWTSDETEKQSVSITHTNTDIITLFIYETKNRMLMSFSGV